MPAKSELLVMVESLKNMLISRATGGQGNDLEYRNLRKTLINTPDIKDKLPRFVFTCRDLSEFWGVIKIKFGTYQERRNYLRDEFADLLTELESSANTPSDDAVTASLSVVDSEHVKDSWGKALERRATDPEGAITAARTLLESVCKYILDEENVEYKEGVDLPGLFGLTIKQLSLAPSQHTEMIFKQILGGCQTVVEGLGALRNKLSDAHGKSKTAVKPAPRHAELAVNLAGTMATFLIAAWEARKKP